MRNAAALALLLALSACNRAPKTYMNACADQSACAGDLTCELVVDLGYVALGDTGATMQVCTMTCSTSEDCPLGQDRQCSDGDGNRARDECVDGTCTAVNCI